MARSLFAEARAFWPEYLAHHRHPANRAFHYLADMVALTSAVASLVLRRPQIALIGAIASVLLVATGHAVIEGNAPLLFRRPLVACLCNGRMAWEALRGVSFWRRVRRVS